MVRPCRAAGCACRLFGIVRALQRNGFGGARRALFAIGGSDGRYRHGIGSLRARFLTRKPRPMMKG